MSPMIDPVPPGSRVYSPADVFPDFDIREYRLASTGGTTVQFAGSNSNRYALYFPSTVAGSVFTWSFFPTTQVNEMTGNTAAAAPLVLTFKDLGPLITYPIYYRSSAPGFNIYVFEISYRPNR